MKKKHGVRKLVVDSRKMLPFYDCTPIRRLLEHVEALELLGKSPNDIKHHIGPTFTHLRRRHYYREQFHLRVASIAKPKGFPIGLCGYLLSFIQF
jgi:hypothetical protein